MKRILAKEVFPRDPGAALVPPHIRSGESIATVTLTILAALAPVSIAVFYLFGMTAMEKLLAAVAAAAAGEALIQSLFRSHALYHYGTAAAAGFLAAMNLPPTAPVWAAALGSLVAVIGIRGIMGRFGYFRFNPAAGAAALISLFVPFPMETSSRALSLAQKTLPPAWAIPGEIIESILHATPLSPVQAGPLLSREFRFGMDFAPEGILSFWGLMKTLAVKNGGGFMGEASALLIVAGAAILLYRRIITWHMPVSFLSVIVLLTLAFSLPAGSPSPWASLVNNIFTGGVFFGAFFIITDMMTTPVTGTGMILSGAGCGVLTFILRGWGGLSWGFFYSVLLMNSLTPVLDRYVRPRVFGKGRAQGK